VKKEKMRPIGNKVISDDKRLQKKRMKKVQKQLTMEKKNN
jgi:hypothetical protein